MIISYDTSCGDVIKLHPFLLDGFGCLAAAEHPCWLELGVCKAGIYLQVIAQSLEFFVFSLDKRYECSKAFIIVVSVYSPNLTLNVSQLM